MTRSGPILTLLTGMVTTAALAALSIAMPPALQPAADDTTTASAGEDATVNRQGPAAEAPATEPTDTPATEAPATEAPATEPTDTPATEAPATEAPAAAPTDTPAAEDARVDYAGRVQGTRGLLAISVRGAKAIGYFCDGKTEAWFQGTASGGELLLEGFGGATVNAALAGGKATGELWIGAQRWDFTAPTVRKPSGLYKATALIRGAKLVAGWIYLPDGSRVGAATLDDELIPAEIPEPGERTVINGVEVDPKNVDEFIGAL
ncbi:hypothetical protein [Nonomuraea basaltis]|uniref:hypothetical protein n=1 Tax=Nonomuraea basaltis TaxID=2495887 RepID=UPI00110C64F5|nr:hypothetical protein [Nonomuraea basaltis]TMR91213.1 hypothetical protein EJK15_51160 [Nonomuraea basaltis]